MTKVLGVNSDTSICECCGKTNLKRVVVLELNNGQIVRYGTTCASKKFRGTKADIGAIVEYQNYIAKWRKYDDATLARALWERFGCLAVAKEDGIYVELDKLTKVS